MAEFNRQEIFDRVVKHRRTQGKKSMYGSGCAYRGADDTMCAIGCLITEEHYNPHFECMTVCSEAVLEALRKSLGLSQQTLSYENTALLRSLQGIHDNHTPELWPDRLLEVAQFYGLEYNPPESK